MSPERSTRLPAQTLALYALPTAGMTSMHWLIMVFLLKFSTDTLGIEPMMVGAITNARTSPPFGSQPRRLGFLRRWACFTSSRTPTRFAIRRGCWPVF